MKILSLVLFLAAALLLGLAGLRTYSLMLYNRRRRRRRRRPRPLDSLTMTLYVTAAVALIISLAIFLHKEPQDPVQTDPPASGSQQAEDPTEGGSKTGLTRVGGVTYYLDENGIPLTGWQDIGDDRYYFDETGAMQTGWLELYGVRYYLREDGTMARGRVDIDGTAHYFTSDGASILLVNPWNPVPDGYEPNLVPLDTYYGSEGMQVDRSCLEALMEMINDCNATGSRAYVLSSYRSLESQQRLFDRKVASLMAEGMSRSDAEAQAGTVVVKPGTSEHHLGLAVDIIDTSLWALEEEQEDLPAQKWLMENCWRYGFILRYPKDKTESTGVIYEPWHYRYLGKALAEEIHNSGLTLEEYLESLN